MGDTAAASPPTAAKPFAGKFTTGSIRQHILVMTGTGAIGLMAIFLGDLANIFFLSLLKDVEIVAAVGYASSILFLTTSIGIGLSIATTALVSPALGSGDRVLARRLAASSLAFTTVVAAATALLIWFLIVPMLRAMGATGQTLSFATSYAQILVPFVVPLAAGMALSSVLRSVGDARRSMNVTLYGAVVNIVLDPILIFALGLGLEGAAIASAVSRVAIFGIALFPVVRIHDLIDWPRLDHTIEDGTRILATAGPAVLTNMATPAANAYVTAAFAPYGDDAVAAWALVGRIAPVAFGAIYALSGSIGPIIGQNFGVRDRERMRKTVTEGVIIAGWFTLAAWGLLLLTAEPLILAFSATAETAALMRLFCRWLAPLFVFLGALFVANAVFNTLGHPKTATIFNWGRATIGTVPFVVVGGHLAGAQGVLIGNSVGQIVFGTAAVWFSYRLIDRLVEEKVPTE